MSAASRCGKPAATGWPFLSMPVASAPYSVALNYESTDCSGPTLLSADEEQPLARVAILRNGLIRFPGGNLQTRVIRSQKYAFSTGGESSSQSSPFGPDGLEFQALGQEETLAPDTLNLTPPFRLVRQ
jgi:hypothetical protein